MSKNLLIGLVVLAVVIGGGAAAWAMNGMPGFNPGPVACTLEAKICPDGTTVGRTGPNCEFAVCPTASTTTPTSEAERGTLSGTMTIGPVCPVEQADNPCKPTPEMFAARMVAIYTSDKKTLVITLTPDAYGKFSVALAAGTYYVTMAATQGGVESVSGVPATITIQSGVTAHLNIDIDTGIR